jgi:hypothetical protein
MMEKIDDGGGVVLGWLGDKEALRLFNFWAQALSMGRRYFNRGGGGGKGRLL